MSSYEMVICQAMKLFIYMTYVVVKLEKIWVKICNLLKGKIPTHLIFFYVLSKQNGFFYLSFTSGSNI